MEAEGHPAKLLQQRFLIASPGRFIPVREQWAESEPTTANEVRACGGQLVRLTGVGRGCCSTGRCPGPCAGPGYTRWVSVDTASDTAAPSDAASRPGRG